MAFKLPFFPRLDRAALAGAGQGQAQESALTVGQLLRSAPQAAGTARPSESNLPGLLDHASGRRLPVLGS